MAGIAVVSMAGHIMTAPEKSDRADVINWLMSSSSRTRKEVSEKDGKEYPAGIIWKVAHWTKSDKVIELLTGIKPGSEIFVSGEVDVDEWKDAKTGEARYRLTLNASQWRLVGGKVPF